MAYALRAPGGPERVAVLTDLLAFIRERAKRPDTSQEGIDLLAALDERLSLELAAAHGTLDGAGILDAAGDA